MIGNKKTALQKATDLLARQDQSSVVLRRKLLARKYEAHEVDEAIYKLQKYNYLNDEELCRHQFENFYAEGKLSLRQILTKLIQRGFDKNFIEQLIPDDFEEHERLVAANMLAKKFPRDENFNPSKAWQFLSSRGFDREIISAILNSQ